MNKYLKKPKRLKLLSVLLLIGTLMTIFSALFVYNTPVSRSNSLTRWRTKDVNRCCNTAICTADIKYADTNSLPQFLLKGDCEGADVVLYQPKDILAIGWLLVLGASSFILYPSIQKYYFYRKKR